MFTFLRGLISKDLLVELSESKISIKAFSSDINFEAEPFIAIEKTNKGEVIKAIGIEAKRSTRKNVTVINPFQHSRSFIADFFLAEKIIQHGVFEIHKSRLRPAPRIIIHQLEKTEGGLTSIEDRVLRELAFGAGARDVLVYLGNRIDISVDSFNSIKSKVLAT